MNERPYFNIKSRQLIQEGHLSVYNIRLFNSINWWMIQKPLRKSCIPHDWYEHWKGMEGLWNIPSNKLLPYQSTLTISSGGSVQKIIYRHLLGNHATTCNLKWLISPQNVLVSTVLYTTLLSWSELWINLLEQLLTLRWVIEISRILNVLYYQCFQLNVWSVST